MPDSDCGPLEGGTPGALPQFGTELSTLGDLINMTANSIITQGDALTEV